MVDFTLAENDKQLTVLYILQRHLHETKKYLVSEAFLHLGDIHHVPVSQFLKLLIVDIGSAHGGIPFSEYFDGTSMNEHW